jgi:hypothetical protein
MRCSCNCLRQAIEGAGTLLDKDAPNATIASVRRLELVAYLAEKPDCYAERSVLVSVRCGSPRTREPVNKNELTLRPEDVPRDSLEIAPEDEVFNECLLTPR